MSKKVSKPIGACSPKPLLKERALISQDEASGLVGLFKILGNETRLRLLHALARESELCVGDLAQEVAMTTQAVSNQLQRLVERQVVTSRRQGNSIFYRLKDPCVAILLDRGLCMLEESVEEEVRPLNAREKELVSFTAN